MPGPVEDFEKLGVFYLGRSYDLDARSRGPGLVLYVPVLLGAATVRFADKKAGVDVTEDVTVVTAITGQAVPVRWEEASAIDVEVGALENAPREPARYAELPAAATKPKRYETWSRDLRTDPLTARLEPVVVKPKKTDVSVRLVALAWAPHRQEPQGGLTPAWT